jgi:hypothetical protein
VLLGHLGLRAQGVGVDPDVIRPELLRGQSVEGEVGCVTA